MELLLRSMLFAPANNPIYMEKAVRSAADAVVFDLEDAVPSGGKDAARRMLTSFLEGGGAAGRTAFLRVGAPNSPDMPRDLAVGIHPDITGFVAPKVSSADDLVFLDRMLGLIEREKGARRGGYKLLPMIENTRALMDLRAIVHASPRIVAVCFGSYDYRCDLRLMSDDGSLFMKFPRALIAAAARSAGVQAIDTPYFDVRDMDGLRAEKRDAFALGFSGSLIITPRHAGAVNECFSPSREMMAFADGALQAAEAARREGASLAVYEGIMIDEPVELLAREIRERGAPVEREDDTTEKGETL
jgi:citrate lyase beta subunit